METIQRHYVPIEPPKSKVVKYLKAFNYAFLPIKMKIILIAYTAMVATLYIYYPEMPTILKWMFPLGAIFGTIFILGSLKEVLFGTTKVTPDTDIYNPVSAGYWTVGPGSDDES